jgi:hypothetical protein
MRTKVGPLISQESSQMQDPCSGTRRPVSKIAVSGCPREITGHTRMNIVDSHVPAENAHPMYMVSFFATTRIVDSSNHAGKSRSFSSISTTWCPSSAVFVDWDMVHAGRNRRRSTICVLAMISCQEPPPRSKDADGVGVMPSVYSRRFLVKV